MSKITLAAFFQWERNEVHTDADMNGEMFFIHEKLTSTVRPWEIKKWPDTTMVRIRWPDSSFDSKTFKKIRQNKNLAL